MTLRHMRSLGFTLMMIAGFVSIAWAQDDRAAQTGGQSRESMANDQSASQWTFLLGYQWMDYRTDEIEPGETRSKGIDGNLMARVVMPIPKGKLLPVSLLPRLTMRLATAQDGHTGLGAGDLFILVIAADWGSGRFGLGPLVTTPASDERLGLTEWTFGWSAGVGQRFFNDRLSVFAVVGQSYGRLDPFRPEAEDVEAPLVINPVATYQLTDAWYVSTGDLVIRFDRDANAWLVPVGLRVGRLWVQEKGTWNGYIEYQTSVIYKDWPGSAVEHQLRLTVGYSIPVS